MKWKDEYAMVVAICFLPVLLLTLGGIGYMIAPHNAPVKEAPVVTPAPSAPVPSAPTHVVPVKVANPKATGEWEGLDVYTNYNCPKCVQTMGTYMYETEDLDFMKCPKCGMYFEVVK